MPSASYIIGSATIWSQKPGIVYEYLTSTVYPLEILESFDIAAGVTSFRAFTISPELADIKIGVVSIDVRSLVIALDPTPELMDIEIDVVSMSVLTIVVENDAGPELMDIEAEVTSVALTGYPLITHSQPNEDLMDFEAAVISLTIGIP